MRICYRDPALSQQSDLCVSPELVCVPVDCCRCGMAVCFLSVSEQQAPSNACVVFADDTLGEDDFYVEV